MSKRYFEYDRLIKEEDFCNFSSEKEKLFDHICAGDCVKIFGPRNFGKTSLVKNIVADKWVKADANHRAIIYADFYSVLSLHDISLELTKAFNHALAGKKSLFDKGLDWIKTLKQLRPVWSPSLDGDGVGEFSIKTESNSSVIDFELIFQNVNELQRAGKMNFLIILDEFQEISKIKAAEARLRNALQCFTINIPVVILGSKQHLLNQIFNRPKSPFYSWGITMEIEAIPYQQYCSYMNQRFVLAQKKIGPEISHYLQDKMNRIPESINRLCDIIARELETSVIDIPAINCAIKILIDQSRSLYEIQFASLNINQRKVVIALAQVGKITSITGVVFLQKTNGVSKSGVAEIVKKLLDESVISRVQGEYCLTDPLFREYVIQHKAL